MQPSIEHIDAVLIRKPQTLVCLNNYARKNRSLPITAAGPGCKMLAFFDDMQTAIQMATVRILHILWLMKSRN